MRSKKERTWPPSKLVKTLSQDTMLTLVALPRTAGAFREMATPNNTKPSSLRASAGTVSAVVGADGAQVSFAPAHGDGRQCATLDMKVGWLP